MNEVLVYNDATCSGCGTPTTRGCTCGNHAPQRQAQQSFVGMGAGASVRNEGPAGGPAGGKLSHFVMNFEPESELEPTIAVANRSNRSSDGPSGGSKRQMSVWDFPAPA